MPKKKKILIFGNTGMLGSEFVQQLKKAGYSLSLPTRKTCDISKKGEIEKTINNKYDLVINCAGLVDVDFCQNHHKQAIKLNILAPYFMAVACLAKDVEFMHFGSTCDQKLTNVYSMTKKVSAGMPDSIGMKKYYVFKTDILFGGGRQKRQNFVELILFALKNKQKLGITDNRWSSPTYAKDLVELCINFYKKKKYGIYKVANQGRVTRWELANEIAKIVGTKHQFYINNKFDDVAPRCLDSSIKTKLLRPYKQALKEYIHESHF